MRRKRYKFRRSRRIGYRRVSRLSRGGIRL